MEVCRHSEAARTAAARHVGQCRPAQAAAGCEEGDGLQDVGLARPVLAGEDDKAGRRLQPQVGVIAEVGKAQARKGHLARVGLFTRP
jgi:hypothetical protein